MIHADNCKCPICQILVPEPILESRTMSVNGHWHYEAKSVFWTGKTWKVNYLMTAPDLRQKKDTMPLAAWNQYVRIDNGTA